MRNRDIIKQYVNTGNCITEYQYNKLNKNLLKSYTRKRLLNHKNKPFEIYELINLNNDVFKSIIDEMFESFVGMHNISNLLEINYDARLCKKLIENNINLNDMFKMLEMNNLFKVSYLFKYDDINFILNAANKYCINTRYYYYNIIIIIILLLY